MLNIYSTQSGICKNAVISHEALFEIGDVSLDEPLLVPMLAGYTKEVKN